MASLNFQTKILRPRASLEEYAVYRAGLEWDLIEPIIIESRKDIKSEKSWRDRVEPFHHQVTNLITFCRRLPVTLLADDVGLGKTISAGLIMSELISRSRLSKALIVCPKLLGNQWKEELESKFNIPAEIAIGKDLIKAEISGVGAIITTYDSARRYIEDLEKDRFQMLILDEAHKLRNLYGTDEPPQVAKRFRKALEERRFRFVLMLTATPIHNRLWDLYSLVDLLTVARGHQNPFGSEGMFVRKFIADNREQARKLKPEARDEFRSIVYSYMSRVRRGDANLYFPDRVVQMHKIQPTIEELQLIEAIAAPIQKLNRLAQISILQALTSSPDALMAQLKNMARNGTVEESLAVKVSTIVKNMTTSAKLNGLGELIDQLRQESPEKWRAVIFTGRIETQTTIQAFLEKRGIKVGIINGSSGFRNQETISKFKQTPPSHHVIISTEAGSEGINLQVANVLVNFDLPWNPMIVEQRIGRIQRLASEHAKVAVFNITLKDTFEEYIVGRLMEKLQLASHAIGDIEALLEASGLDEDEGIKFDEKIRQLVVASLTGKDCELATRKIEESIAQAKKTLIEEENQINSMLGGMDDPGYIGPRPPKLPSVEPSMKLPQFTLAAFSSLGAKINKNDTNIFSIQENSHTDFISFEENPKGNIKTIFYGPGSANFLRLVGRIIASGVHNIEDLDKDIARTCEQLVANWAEGFGAISKKIKTNRVWRLFEGAALLRVRVSVALDSYERLIEVPCIPSEHKTSFGQEGLESLPRFIEKPNSLGLDSNKLMGKAKDDFAISEFSRFYLERRDQEMQAAGNDERKRKKLEDDFTPRYEITLVALEGKLHRELETLVNYNFNNEQDYSSSLTIRPHDARLISTPEMSQCARSGKMVPNECLKQCEISGMVVLQHLLVKSELSSRLALPEFIIKCEMTNKRILQDEAEKSAISGHLVFRSLLKTSVVSGKRGEPEFFNKCEFTSGDALLEELSISEVSGKRYRSDQHLLSSVSGKTGHASEFIFCHVTKQPLLPSEAEKCELTGCYVRPGILEACEITGKRVLPSELEKCAVTGKKALKKFFVMSSITGARLLEDVAVQSAGGRFCLPIEAKTCIWSGNNVHPDDLRECSLTGLPIYFGFASVNGKPELQPLSDLLHGIKRTQDGTELWKEIESKLQIAVGKGRCHIIAGIFSPDKRHIAACSELRTLFGLRTRKVAFLFSLADKNLIGRIVQGHS